MLFEQMSIQPHSSLTLVMLFNFVHAVLRYRGCYSSESFVKCDTHSCINFEYESICICIVVGFVGVFENFTKWSMPGKEYLIITAKTKLQNCFQMFSIYNGWTKKKVQH